MQDIDLMNAFATLSLQNNGLDLSSQSVL